MKHYDQAQWLQFLRAELDPELHAAMQRHLDTPCGKCSTTLSLLRKIEATAQADAQLDVPESAVRIARAIFALNKPQEVQLKPGILAKLVFDSFREPAAAGVRSGRQLARQTMYEAGDYTIDLRFEPDLDPAQVVMVGQIANRVVPELPPRSVPIVLRGGGKELGRAVTNQFGEFQVVYRPKMPLRLLVSVLRGSSDHVEIRVPGSPRKGSADKASSRLTAGRMPKARSSARRKSDPGTEKF
jgi:hypothetical protein